MKNLIIIILSLSLAAALVFGLMQSGEAAKMKARVEQAEAKVIATTEEARTQEEIARQQSASAEMAMRMAAEAQQRAEQALADCKKRRK